MPTIRALSYRNMPSPLTEFAMADYQTSATRVCYTTYVTDIFVISIYIVIRIKTRLCLVYTHTFSIVKSILVGS